MRFDVRAWLSAWIICPVLAIGCYHAPRHCCCQCYQPCGSTSPCHEAATPLAPLPAAPAQVLPPVSTASAAAATNLPAVSGSYKPMEKAELTTPRRQEASSGSVVLAHDPNYRWLAGELWYNPAQAVWRVHYATLKDEDKYGGIITLADTGPMKDFRIGQLVYVEGHLDTGAGNPSSAVYRVSKVLELVNAQPGVLPAQLMQSLNSPAK